MRNTLCVLAVILALLFLSHIVLGSIEERLDLLITEKELQALDLDRDRVRLEWVEDGFRNRFCNVSAMDRRWSAIVLCASAPGLKRLLDVRIEPLDTGSIE